MIPFTFLMVITFFATALARWTAVASADFSSWLTCTVESRVGPMWLNYKNHNHTEVLERLFSTEPEEHTTNNETKRSKHGSARKEMSQRKQTPHVPNPQYTAHFTNKQKQMSYIQNTHNTLKCLANTPCLRLHTDARVRARTPTHTDARTDTHLRLKVEGHHPEEQAGFRAGRSTI